MLIIGLPGKTLTAQDRDWLATPQVSGVILFTRNFDNREQVTTLIDDLRADAARSVPASASTRKVAPCSASATASRDLPALARIGELYARDPARRLRSPKNMPG